LDADERGKTQKTFKKSRQQGYAQARYSFFVLSAYFRVIPRRIWLGFGSDLELL
jgi:hypothetical protein